MQGKILIVDDNPVILELLERKLSREGYEVRGCAESARALHVCLQFQPDLMILDIAKPYVFGDLLEKISKVIGERETGQTG
jgi:DNA-binding response OmpR family regulator